MLKLLLDSQRPNFVGLLRTLFKWLTWHIIYRWKAPDVYFPTQQSVDQSEVRSKSYSENRKTVRELISAKWSLVQSGAGSLWTGASSWPKMPKLTGTVRRRTNSNRRQFSAAKQHSGLLKRFKSVISTHISEANQILRHFCGRQTSLEPRKVGRICSNSTSKMLTP